LQFKIKDQDYFLAFVEQEKRWYVFAPTSDGVNRIPVYVDAVKYEKPGILETETHLSFYAERSYAVFKRVFDQ
jgi:hypothetical protein